MSDFLEAMGIVTCVIWIIGLHVFVGLSILIQNDMGKRLDELEKKCS